MSKQNQNQWNLPSQEANEVFSIWLYSMLRRVPVNLIHPRMGSIRGIIQSIEAEDGSGKSFNVVIQHPEHGKIDVYHRFNEVPNIQLAGVTQ